MTSELKVNVFGTGAPFIAFFHGYLGQGLNLRAVSHLVTRKLTRGTALLVDLPGHGQSRALRNDENLHSMAQSVLEALTPLVNEKVHLVGHSLGGRVALKLAQEHSAFVKSLVMLDITPAPIDASTQESIEVARKLEMAKATAENRGEMRKALAELGIEAMTAEWLLMNFVKMPDGKMGWRIDRSALRRVHPTVSLENLFEGCENLKTPWLIIYGDASIYAPEQHRAQAVQYGAQVFSVPSGHNVHVEAVEQVAQRIAEFVNSASN